jgi:hypothetical protein
VSTCVKVRLRLPSVNAIQWTDNDDEVHKFIRRHGWTTRYMSGAGGDAMYLHPRQPWLTHREVSVRRGCWIVQGVAGQPDLRVVEEARFPSEYDLVGSEAR